MISNVFVAAVTFRAMQNMALKKVVIVMMGDKFIENMFERKKSWGHSQEGLNDFG